MRATSKTIIQWMKMTKIKDCGKIINNNPGKLYGFLLLILCHSYDEIKKQIKMKKVNKKLPLIIKKRATGIIIKELIILFDNSLLIIFFQNFV